MRDTSEAAAPNTPPIGAQDVSRAVTGFWDELFLHRHAGADPLALEAPDRPVVAAALDYFGDLRGRTLLDLGSGRGAMSVAFARAGAHVVSLDASRVAVDGLRRYCDDHGVRNIAPVCASALDPAALLGQPLGPGGAALGPVDCVFGSMILHHLEPFADFAAGLRRALRRGGQGFFFENNARSPLLVWFRDHVVGRGWVPKFGDPEEFPLTPDEVAVLARHFRVDVSYPWLKFFRLGAQYLFRGRGEGVLTRLDEWAYESLPGLRAHSYVQYLRLS